MADEERDIHKFVRTAEARLRQPSPHRDVYSVCSTVARVLKHALPLGFTGKLTVTIDNGEVAEHNVAVEFRPPQPKAGMGR